MSEVEDLMRACARSTEEMEEHVGTAMGLLDLGVASINPLGVYKDPVKRRQQLEGAKAAIERAIKVQAETIWPIPADYRALQKREH
jgi:hypothetical protein